MGELRNFRPDGSGEPPRRLAAIIVGDIVSYSRLMQHDEEGTHARVKRIQRDLIETSIAEHHGKLVKTTGDGFIAVFDSPVEAVRCSIVIQQNLLGRNAALPRETRIEYRIGVNLGDVIVEPDDIYGDGVNIATRIEGLAQPGEVYISGAIYEQIKHKVVCGYESMGDRRVKNITDPVRIYRVLPDAGAYARVKRRRESVLAMLLGIALIAMASGVLWNLLPLRRHAPPSAAAISVPAPDQVSPRPAARQSPPSPAPAPPPPVPETVPLSGGSFQMGSAEDPSERPVHLVAVAPFAIGRYPVTVREWNACFADAACSFVSVGDDDEPVRNASWNDAKQYVGWLAGRTGRPYRLPSEAEWEYAARGGTQTRYWWGERMMPGLAACRDCGEAAPDRPGRVSGYGRNPFGLHQMGGGIDQWVEDCWHKNYHGAPTDGSAWTSDDCASHVIRSGSWKNDAKYVRPSNRDGYDTAVRYPTHGFRVALGP